MFGMTQLHTEPSGIRIYTSKAKNINTIKEFAKYLIVKLFEKIKFHPNDLIKNLTIIDSSSLLQSSLFYSLFDF
jgi:hypothetical protein